MLLIETTVGPSEIHGLGCFAAEFVPEGRVIWKLDRRIDQIFYESRLHTFPPSLQTFFQFHGFVSTYFWRRCVVLSGDNDRFMNHSDTPNVARHRATRDIEVGEELTCDYWQFDLEAGKKLGADSQKQSLVQLPSAIPKGLLLLPPLRAFDAMLKQKAIQKGLR